MEQKNYIERVFCPSCGDKHSERFLDVPDYRFSHDIFPINRCLGCGLHYTASIPSVDDIGAFYKADSYDSHRLDNVSLISRLYRFVRRINVRKKVSWVRKYLKSGVVVDYGCGLGHFVQGLRNAGYNAEGYEIDADARALAQSELNLKLQSLERFKLLTPASVDVLTMWHVLEHVYDLNADVELLLQKLRPGGFLFVAVPNFRSYDAQYYGAYWEAYDVPRHLYHFDQSCMKSFGQKFGLIYQEAIPMKFDSYYVAMRSEKNKPGGSLLNGLRIGFWSNVQAAKHGYSSHVFVFKKPA